MYLHVLDRLEKEILKTLSINLVIPMFLLYKFDKVCLSNKLFYSINIKKKKYVIVHVDQCQYHDQFLINL